MRIIITILVGAGFILATTALVAHPTVLTTVGALLVWLATSVIVYTAYVRRSQ